MNKKNSIYELPEIISSLNEYRRLKASLKKERNNLSKLFDKYEFLDKIFSKTVGDFELEYEIEKLFKSLSYKTKKPKDKRDFDVIVKNKTYEIGIEVKNGNLPAENKLFQAYKYATRQNKIESRNIHALIVWNNAKTNQEFDNYRIIDAKLNNYGLLTTKELISGFIKIKKGKLTLSVFEKLVKKKGLIKFSNKYIKESESSDGL
ncbi:MAG: hypothetical protein ACQETL_14705 [Bacteroidota bacterium]